MVDKKKVTKKRDLSYEVIRVVAMFLIVFTHEINTYLEKGSVLATTIEAFTAVGVTLFFMLSGRFAFKMNLEDKSLYKKYYWKKVIGLIIPMLVYMLIKNYHVMAYNKGLTVTPLFYIKQFGIALVNGFSYMEYWFLYVLIALLIAVPFTARMVQNMQKRDKKAFVIVGLIMAAISTIMPFIANVEFAVKYEFIGYVLFFYVGAFIEELFDKKKYKVTLYIVGLLSLIVTMILSNIGAKNGYKSFSPLYFFFTTAMFIGIHDLAAKFMQKKRKIFESAITFLGKHSLGVYMFHMIVLYFINDLNFISRNIFGWFVASIIVTIISSIICFVIDSTIVKLLQKICIKIFKLDKVLK